ncbi:hypothetical protein HHK36_031506 [Tetracentron sinense]|uniref:Uncharacterized protein n=1 Tax=Tetracentron sinense TaxID=13715 RepID=A0A834Y902_TETSI|nr:hypothetical protein HHK36_031506 [Tetracentron sinense]
MLRLSRSSLAHLIQGKREKPQLDGILGGFVDLSEGCGVYSKIKFQREVDHF